MDPEVLGHQDTLVKLDRHFKVVRAYAEGKATASYIGKVEEITLMAIQRAKDAGQDTKEYEEELEVLMPAIGLRHLRDRISGLADKINGPRMKSRETQIINEIRDIRHQIEKLEQTGVDVSGLREMFFSLTDKPKPVK